MERLYSVCLLYFGLIAYHNTVNGWQCPANEAFRSSYVKSGEQAVLSFQTTLRYFNRQLAYTVTNYKGDVLYAATFYNNIIQNEKTFLGTEFIGDVNTGNFTIKTAAVNSQDGGMYLLQDKEGTAAVSTLKCLILYILGKPQKTTITQDNNNILGRDSRLTCNSLSTTNPTNHTLNLVYNWKVNGVINPYDNTKYIYSSSRNQLTIQTVSKEDANTRFTCNATEFGSITGLSSAESNQLTFQVIYGPDADTTRLSPPNTQYTLHEGVTLSDITCSGECYPRCNYKWLESGTTVNNRAVLSLGQLSKTDAGIYTCEVTNSNTTSISLIKRQIEVQVIFGPDASTTSLTPTSTSYTLNEGSTFFTLHCSGDCYPACNYKWTKTGNSRFTPVNNGNLSLVTIHRDEAGTYTCTVSNPLTRQEQTKTVSISVIFGPDASTTSLTPTSTSYTLNEGSTFYTIHCSGDCYPVCNYKWTKTGNSRFTTVNNGNLSLVTIHRDEAGTYTCTVINPITRQEQTKTVSVSVIYGPDADSLKLNPSKSSYTKNEGTSLYDITCSTACYPKCTYKWTKSGSQFIESDVLSLGALNKDKAATYTCTAYNPTTKHNISTSVNVHVRFGPTVCSLNVPSQYTLTEGKSSTEMTCQADCYPGCTYSWTNLSSNNPVGTNGKFQLMSSKRYEAGTYKCQCENKPLFKEQSSSVVITIQYPPDVTVLQSTTNTTEGNNLTLTCDANGVPSVYQYNSLTQTWYGVLIPNTNSEKIGTPKYSSIYISSLQLQDSGTYSCFVNNGVNTTDSTSSVKIKVKGFPKVLTHLLTFIGKNGGGTIISIQFYSFPDIQDVNIKRYDDKIMKNITTKKQLVLHNEIMVKDRFYGKEVSLIGMEANLQFKKMMPEDFGGYTLILKNEIGEVFTPFDIKAESEPSIPTGFTYENIDGIHSLSWVSGFNGGNRQTFIIQMSVSDQGRWQNRTSITEELGVKNFMVYSVNMSDLTPGTYKARIFAWNKNGYSDYVILNEIITIKEQIKGKKHPVSVTVLASSISIGTVFIICIVLVVSVICRRRNSTKDTCFSSTKIRENTDDRENSYCNLESSSTYESLQRNKAIFSTYESLEMDAGNGRNKEILYENLKLSKDTK